LTADKENNAAASFSMCQLKASVLVNCSHQLATVIE